MKKVKKEKEKKRRRREEAEKKQRRSREEREKKERRRRWKVNMENGEEFCGVENNILNALDFTQKGTACGL